MAKKSSKKKSTSTGHTKSSEPDKTFPEAKTLFWKARRLWNREKKSDEAIVLLESAVGDSKTHSDVKTLFKSLLLAINSEYEKALSCLKISSASSFSEELAGERYFLMASVNFSKQEYVKAIECYQKALDERSFDRPGNAVNNMGIAYDEKKDYDKAIECYQKALKETSFDMPGSAFYNMGIAYHQKKDYDKAIECYQKALKETSYEAPGHSLFNMGLAFRAKGEPESAKESFRAAKRLFEESGNTVLAGAADSQLEEFNPDSMPPIDEDEEKTKAKLEFIQKYPESTEARILSKLDASEKDSYEKYAAQTAEDPESTVHSPEFSFATLRSWSSTTPLVQATTDTGRGGGYFLRWQGHGLVIDPGHDFLRNFHDANFHARDIDAILVSHDHGDHNQDLKPLDDLMYELHRRDAKSTGDYKYALIWDADSEGRIIFSYPDASHRTKLKYDFDRLEQGIEDCLELKKPKELPFRIKYFKAQHTSDVPNAVGVRLECFSENGDVAFSIGYTGDGEFQEEMFCNENALSNCDILVAHISQPDEEEFWNSDARKKRHLGYRGAVELITKCKPRLTLIGEFWSGLADLRIDLVKGLRDLCKNEYIFPSSRSLVIDPRSLNIKCTSCNHFSSFKTTHVAPAQEPFGSLSYVCETCRLE